MKLILVLKDIIPVSNFFIFLIPHVFPAALAENNSLLKRIYHRGVI